MRLFGENPGRYYYRALYFFDRDREDIKVYPVLRVSEVQTI
jgi:hypothetical protein